jgi:hypothetical protein
MESSKLQINELATILNQHFAWNKARMDCFVGMLIGLLKTRNINLVELATGLRSLTGIALPADPAVYTRLLAGLRQSGWVCHVAIRF